jgi:hypothetical protein
MSAQWVRIASMALRLLFVVQFVLGLLFWFGRADGLVPLHMVIGLLFIIDVWYLGVVQGLQANGSLGLTVGTFVVGLLLAIVGMTQTGILIGGAHWVIQIIHLLLALAAMGLGEASVARYNRGVPTISSAG